LSKNEVSIANKAAGPVATSFYTPKLNNNNGKPTGLTDNGIDIPLQTPLNYSINQITNSIYVNGTDVYVVGGLAGPYNPLLFRSDEIATVWKNGQIFAQYGTDKIIQGNNYRTSVAYSMTIDNGNIYVVGLDNNKATVWLNGIATVLPSNPSIPLPTARFIAVKNSHVCIAGTLNSGEYAFWINGVLTTLPASSVINGVVISNTNIMYAVGQTTVNGVTKAYRWTKSLPSGVLTNNALYELSGTTSSTASSVAIDNYNNGEVYASVSASTTQGSKGFIQTIYNPIRGVFPINTLTSNGSIGSITTFNGNTYAVGINNSVNTLWSNTVASTFNGLSPGVYSSNFAVK
jgi:hypothetical protein